LTRDVDVNAAALDYVVSLISPTAHVQRIKNKDTEILLASTIKTDTPDFGYLVHIDVVAAPTELFQMTLSGDRILGRGVSDMKFSIPLGVALLSKQSSISFCLAITTDEEVGGFDGAAYLAEELMWRPKSLIVPDGGDNMSFVDKAKGIANFTVTATGKSAHASRPWDGHNALPSLCKLVIALEEKYGPNLINENWDTTLNFGQLHGGISTNQVCDSAVLKLDYRYPETDSKERIENELSELTQMIDPTLKIEAGPAGLPTYTDITSPIVQKFLSSLQTTFEEKIVIKPTYGGSDARHFARFGTPVLMIKPHGGDIHCQTEYIEIESTMKFYQGLRNFLELM
jgi:succinyl-diaminopimelate desuccinylase